MIYFIIYLFFAPFLCIKRLFKPSIKGKILLIQTAKIGDYANSSVLFEPLKKLDIVLCRQNLAFANHDERIQEKFIIDEYKKGLLAKLKLAFLINQHRYETCYVLMPNALNLFIARLGVGYGKCITIIPPKPGSSIKLLSLGMKKIYHNTSVLSMLSYLKMLDIDELSYQKCIQKPLYIPKSTQIPNNNKFKVGISFSAANKIKTPPIQTWQKIFDILAQFECEVYVFGIKDDDAMLKQLDTTNINVKSLVNKIALENLPYEIAKLGLYISSDTGNYYIADTMKISTICLMGPCFASEQRGTYDTLIIQPDLPPFTSVFATITDKNCPQYYTLTKDDERKINFFIQDRLKHLIQNN